MNFNLDRLDALEKESKKLELQADERKHFRELVVDQTETFLEDISEGPGYTINPEESAKINEEQLTEYGDHATKLVPTLARQMDIDGINPASGFHMGYVPGGGIYASSLADYWVDITNRYAGVYFANPGAVKLENKLIRWMCRLVGYPAAAFGNLTSGGSLASLTAIVTAREARKVDYSRLKSYTVYMTSQAHHCLKKAFKIAGLAGMTFRVVNMDDRFRMDVNHLQKLLKEDQFADFKPFMIIGSAGTTDTGAIDPLAEISAVANVYNAWYHIDAAYGGFFMLTEEGSQKMKGIELSDSLVMDPHKSLFLPYGSGVVLVRNVNYMLDAFSETANYLQDMDPEKEDISPADVSTELTKPFRGMRMWLPLKLHGLAPFRAALEEKFLLTRYFYTEINKIRGFRTPPLPDLTTVPFWYESEGIDSNSFNKELIREIHQDGRIFLSSTTIGDQFVIRMCILVFRTHKREVDIALNIIRDKVATVAKKFEKITR